MVVAAAAVVLLFGCFLKLFLGTIYIYIYICALYACVRQRSPWTDDVFGASLLMHWT